LKPRFFLRRSVEDLNRFYASPEGGVARTMVRLKLTEAWGDVRGLDILGIGYCTPYLDLFGEGRRVLSAMPAAQGAEIWPRELKVRSLLIDETALPFATAMFDRILLIHALEEAAYPQKLLEEAARLLSPNGRIIIAVAARGGLWAHADKTPFGYGLPYSRSQLEEALREAELEPLAWSYALYVPPVQRLLRWAGSIEAMIPRFLPISGGLILMEAGRKPFIALKQQADRSLMSELRQVLSPKPVTAGPVPAVRDHR
jgi:SAM-dependent methyltransferase